MLMRERDRSMVEWFVVGGSIRDLLLGRGLKDVDFSFRGGTEEFLQLFPHARNTGRDLPIWLAGGTEYTALKEGWEEDFARRDLTVNACAMDADGRLHAHLHFAADLRSRTLRLASRRSLEDDPLRLFRAARFCASMAGFAMDPGSLAEMRSFSASHRAEIAALPRERVGRELMRALESPRPSLFLRTLRQADCLAHWFAEFSSADGIPAGPLPWHDNSVLEHTYEVMDRCAGSPLAVWMAMCHDMGKVMTRPEVLPHHYGHEKRGSEMAGALGKRLGLPSRWIKAGVVGTLCHMKGGTYGKLRAGTRRDMLLQLESAGIMHDFWILAAADSGLDWEQAAQRELRAIKEVRLPREWQGLGEESGRRLRDLQCAAISRLPCPVAEKLSG